MIHFLSRQKENVSKQQVTNNFLQDFSFHPPGELYYEFEASRLCCFKCRLQRYVVYETEILRMTWGKMTLFLCFPYDYRNLRLRFSGSSQNTLKDVRATNVRNITMFSKFYYTNRLRRSLIVSSKMFSSIL